MGERMRRKGRSDSAPRHVRLYYYLLTSPAWKSLTSNARAIYVEMAMRYAGHGTNNGRLSYSIGEACRALRIGRATACRAIKELVDRGFIVVAKRGAFSLKLRHATEWRLTEFPCDITGATATKDFMRWIPDGRNTSSVTEPTVPRQNSHKFWSGTGVAEKAHNRF